MTLHTAGRILLWELREIGKPYDGRAAPGRNAAGIHGDFDVYLRGVRRAAFTGGIFWAGMLAVFPTLLGHSMANIALKYFKAATVSVVMMTGLITGPLVVLIFLGETPAPFTVVGGLIILIGLALYTVTEWRTAKQAAARRGRDSAMRMRFCRDAAGPLLRRQ